MGIRLDIQNDMAKAEEIKILEKLRDVFQENSDNYLAHLFTNEFTQWASNLIRDDIMVDAMQYIVAGPDEDNILLEKQCRDLQCQVDACQEKFGRVSNEYNQEINAKFDEVEKLKGAASQDAVRMQELVEDIKLRAEVTNSLQLEIVKLKTKLYDLMEI